MNFLENFPVQSFPNGLTILENLAQQRGWALDRLTNGDLMMESVGEHTTYTLQFTWSDEYQSLHITCSMDMQLPAQRLSPINDLLAQVNSKLWIGHFALSEGVRTPAYRHTVLMMGDAQNKAREIEDIIQTGLGECDRFYPAFQYTAFKNMAALDAINCVLMECVGEA